MPAVDARMSCSQKDAFHRLPIQKPQTSERTEKLQELLVKFLMDLLTARVS